MHLHRDKRSAKGGPDGGNGGCGGHVILKGNRNYWTLIHLKYQRHVYAEDGESGSGNLCTGADGQDVIIDVPLGTVAREMCIRDSCRSGWSPGVSCGKLAGVGTNL